jgi:hypothetical protein
MLMVFLGTARPAAAQWTRLDTVLFRSLGDSLWSVNYGHIRVVGDSNVATYFNIASDWPAADLTVIFLDQLSAVIFVTDTMAHLNIQSQVVLISPSINIPERRSWNFNRLISLTPADLTGLETNRSRYIHLEKTAAPSFWESTLEPALVILGAAVIVALFFLIRS